MDNIQCEKGETAWEQRQEQVRQDFYQARESCGLLRYQTIQLWPKNVHFGHMHFKDQNTELNFV